MTDIVLWEPESGKLIPSTAKTAVAISGYAVQLSDKDKRQIVGAFDSGHYEIAISYLWSKTANALKKELSVVGVELLGEMLGRTDVDETDRVEDILTTADAIRLAEELGVVSSTDAMRLRHTNEVVTHFSNLETQEGDLEEIDEAEAIASLKSCIKAVLGRPKVDVARKFVEFRESLESETLTADDTRVAMLASSPYFFLKLTISVLLTAAKKAQGAALEHALANINLLIPLLWPKIRDVEKWQVGHGYAEAYADGKTQVVSGLKSALLKVHGFDFVPENLRSDTFMKAADQIIIAHEGLNNFYNEAIPVKNLLKLGSVIPTPALPKCISAVLCVVVGNSYGTAWNATPDAYRILGTLSRDRWSYYLNRVLPGDIRILNKLLYDKSRDEWHKVVAKYDFASLEFTNRDVEKLIKASDLGDISTIELVVNKFRRLHLG